MAMMNARSVFKGAAIGERAADAVLARANEMLGSDPADGAKAEALYAVYDPRERTVQCARAGGAAVLVSFSQGPFKLLETPEAPPVGTAPGAVYSPLVHPVVPGDVLVVCSRTARIGKTTCRSALLEGNRYGHRSVGDGTEGRQFAVMAVHFGAWQGWEQRNNGGKERARRCSRQARRSVSCCVQVCGVRK